MKAIYEKISELLRERQIDLFAPIGLSDCKITKKYLLEKADISPDGGTAIMIAVPYAVNDGIDGNISEYAKSRDYHLFFASLFGELLPIIRREFPEYRFEGFTDHSPIDEINAAAIAGLGIIGANGLLITKKYSSFVFIGEIVTSAEIKYEKHEVKLCENCGLCLNACPVGCDKQLCLSALTQKKGELSADEAELILTHRSAWGCDICQKICPYTKKAVESGEIYSCIPFFKQKRIPYLTYDLINEMSENEFKERAYSWRGKPTLLRNLSLLEGIDISDK
jgi:epoxyqueuosine reductase